MKKKYADYPTWDRVKEKKYENKYIDNDDFKGNISLLIAVKAKQKFTKISAGEEIIITDDNFKWLEIYPENNKNIAISVTINEKNEIVEWYFDIAKNSGLTEAGVPYIDDLYLDVTLRPSGVISLLDEDELKEALENKEITKEDFELAYEIANRLIKGIDGKVEELTKFTRKYLKLFEEK